jgi:hypothetical protein
MSATITRILFGSAACLLAACALAQAPVTSGVGAMSRANDAVGTANATNSQNAAIGAGNDTSAAPAPAGDASPTLSPGAVPGTGTGTGTDTGTGTGTDAEGGDDIRGMSYDPEGRRDPFRPLTGEAADTELRKKFEGTLKGRLLNEVKLTSILKHPSGNIATFEGGPKKEGYFARVGSEFWDAQVISVDADNLVVVVRQKVDDPRSIKQWRDIVIPLWSEEEKKADSADSASAP